MLSAGAGPGSTLILQLIWLEVMDFMNQSFLSSPLLYVSLSSCPSIHPIQKLYIQGRTCNELTDLTAADGGMIPNASQLFLPLLHMLADCQRIYPYIPSHGCSLKT